MRSQIKSISDSDWQPLLDKAGKKGQASLDIASPSNTEELSLGGYVYRAVATKRDSNTDSEIIHWYNQRAKGSR
jgi:hypothetical protein